MAAATVIYAAPFGTDQGVMFKITAIGTLISGSSTPPTYAAGSVFQCIQSLQWGRELVEAQLEGGNTVCDDYSALKNLTFTLGIGGLDLNKWETFLGATASDLASGGSFVDHGFSDVGAEFGLIVRAPNSSGGDTHWAIFRCKVKEGPGGELSQGNHYAEEWSGIGLKDYYNLNKGIRAIHHTVLTAIPTTWPFTYSAGPPAVLTGY